MFASLFYTALMKSARDRSRNHTRPADIDRKRRRADLNYSITSKQPGDWSSSASELCSYGARTRPGSVARIVSRALSQRERRSQLEARCRSIKHTSLGCTADPSGWFGWIVLMMNLPSSLLGVSSTATTLSFGRWIGLSPDSTPHQNTSRY